MQERIGQSVCDVVCTIGLINKKKEKKEIEKKKECRKSLKEFNENDIKWLLKKTTADCNAYIRERDKNLPCVSCGTTHSIQWDAGHYIPAGRGSALRFDVRNIHKQCCVCNDGNKRSGNITMYRMELVRRHGEEYVAELERIGHTTKKWTVDELKELRKMFRQLLAELKKDSVL